MAVLTLAIQMSWQSMLASGLLPELCRLVLIHVPHASPFMWFLAPLNWTTLIRSREAIHRNGNFYPIVFYYHFSTGKDTPLK